MASSSRCLPPSGRLFFCRFCYHPFYSQHRLETHERIHTGNKPHQCPLCYRAFSQAMYLRFHLEQIHGGSQEQAEVMVHSTSSLQTGTVLDAVVGGDILRTPHFNRSIGIKHETSNNVGARNLSLGERSMILSGVWAGDIRSRPTREGTGMQHGLPFEGRRPIYGSNNKHHEFPCDAEEESVILNVDKGNNPHRESSPEPVGDIMDFAPLFLVEDIPVTAMNQSVSSINIITSDGCTLQRSPQSSSSSQEDPSLAKVRDIPSTDHQPTDSDKTPSPIKTKADREETRVPRKIRKQQTPQRTIFSDEELVTLALSSSPESSSGEDAERDLDESIVPGDVTGIMTVESKSPALTSSILQEKMKRSSSLKDNSDTANCIQSSCPAVSKHGPLLAKEANDLHRIHVSNMSQSCQSHLDDTKMISDRSSPVSLDPSILGESSINEARGYALPEVSRKRKRLTCELCDKTFTGTLFLRSHFRVVHGAEIIGIDSDDNCSVDDEEGKEQCEINGAFELLRTQKAMECDGPKPMKRGRGRPKGSKSKSKDHLKSISEQLGHNNAKMRVEVGHSNTSGSVTQKKRGRPPKYKVPLNSLHEEKLQNTSSATAHLPHATFSQAVEESVIDPPIVRRQKITNEDLEPFIENNLKKERKEPNITSGGFKCDVCQKVFVNKSDLQRHIRTHTGEQPYACSTCGRRFGDFAHLRDHEKLHSDTKEYECKVCGKRFAQSGGLYSHSRTHEERKYGCKVCSKKFTRKSDVQRHLRTHAGLKPFRCNVCQQGFNSEKSLQDHGKLHSEERKYVCSECGARFAGRNGLHSHFKTHIDKEYECKICSKMFSRNSDWHRHMKTHKSE